MDRIIAKFKSRGSIEKKIRKAYEPSKHIEEVELEICLDVEHKKTIIQDIAIANRTDVNRESLGRILSKMNFSLTIRNSLSH